LVSKASAGAIISVDHASVDHLSRNDADRVKVRNISSRRAP
jgi:hypothetical protein